MENLFEFNDRESWECVGFCVLRKVRSLHHGGMINDNGTNTEPRFAKWDWLKTFYHDGDIHAFNIHSLSAFL